MFHYSDEKIVLRLVFSIFRINHTICTQDVIRTFGGFVIHAVHRRARAFRDFLSHTVWEKVYVPHSPFVWFEPWIRVFLLP